MLEAMRRGGTLYGQNPADSHRAFQRGAKKKHHHRHQRPRSGSLYARIQGAMRA